MEIYENADTRSVEIWLTQAERSDNTLQKGIKTLYKKYHEKKYFVATFYSGEQNLFDLTSSLLCYNHKRMAQLEVERDKKQNKSTVI